MAVPKAAVNEDRRFPFWEYEIRAPWQVTPMESKAKAEGMQRLSYRYLGLCVLPTDPSHVMAALSFGQPVDHLSFPVSRQSLGPLPDFERGTFSSGRGASAWEPNKSRAFFSNLRIFSPVCQYLGATSGMGTRSGDDGADCVRRKAERLACGGKPRVVDLFAGCGGMSLGFHSIGCEIVAALEIDGYAAASHAANFFKGSSAGVRDLHARARDITLLEPEAICDEFGLGAVDSAVDFIIGGPPCQAYARVGRAKLREIAEHPEAFKVDPRADLYLRYLHYVERMKPLAIVMENVPDLMNFGGHNVAEEVADALDLMGYVVRYSLLNCAFYGVPQLRDRVILLAVRKELNVVPTFPLPTRHMLLPMGYDTNRTVAYKSLSPSLPSAFIKPSLDDKKPLPVTVSDAIGDLPMITCHLRGELKRGAKRFDQITKYDDARPLSEYGRLMRGWDGFKNDAGIYDHVIRHLPRDISIFRKMDEGAEYPEAHRVAVVLFHNALKRHKRRTGTLLSPSERKELRGKMVPPYSIDTFPNKWWKLRADAPSRTLMAHLGKDGYSHIHYDSSQARVISVREAARLQSFPDGFVFRGTMNPAFKQIGNAVPPLFAKAIGETLLATLLQAVRRISAVAA